MPKLAIIGCGTMGRAIVQGLGRSDGGWTVSATVRHAESAARLAAELGVEAGTDNVAALAGADVVLLGVKPQGAAEVFADPAFVEAVRGKLVISICAGVTLKQLTGWAPGLHAVRAMPNTPALIGEGMSVVSPGPGVTADELAVARRIFEAVGRCRVRA
jgi:pyrroline-5-carboxylate reductase